MTKPNELVLSYIIKFCQTEFHRFPPEKAVNIVNELNILLNKIIIRLAEGYELSLKQLKECLKLFNPDLKEVDNIVFLYNLREEKCIKTYKTQGPIDIVKTFAELYFNRSDIRSKDIERLISDVKRDLWKKSNKLEEEIAYLERLQSINGEAGMMISGMIEDLMMELDQIDEKIMELDALLELLKSRLKETDRYLIIERGKLKGLVFMDKYVLLVINVGGLEEIIKCQINEAELNKINNELQNLLKTYVH